MNALQVPEVVGDGGHDDTAGLQAALDSGAATVYLPAPPAAYCISRALVIHSGQTLAADRNAVIRLASRAHAHMLTNDDHARGGERITVTGGIWDGNNAHQTCAYHEGGDWRVSYDPRRYLGVLMQFNRVAARRVRVRNMFGTFRYHAVSFTPHKGHPGAPSTFEDVRLDDAPPSLHIERGAVVGRLSIRGVDQVNHADTPLDFLLNEGEIDTLLLADVAVRAENGGARGQTVVNRGARRGPGPNSACLTPRR